MSCSASEAEGQHNTDVPGGGAIGRPTRAHSEPEATGESPFLGTRSCFFSFPQNDPDKEYNMPKDGTVHELTSNVGDTQTLLARWDKEHSSSDTVGTAPVGTLPAVTGGEGPASPAHRPSRAARVQR